MLKNIIFLSIVVSFFELALTSDCRGCIELEEYAFYKIVKRFKACLVKFDIPYPYGEKHDVFEHMSQELYATDDILLAQVGIKDYADKDNERLGQKYGVMDSTDMPRMFLFRNYSTENPVRFTKDWTLELLRSFLKEHSGIYIGLPGALEVFDNLANKFTKASDIDEKKRILKEMEDEHSEIDKESKERAKSYILYARKILNSKDGQAFVNLEKERLKKLKKDKSISDNNKEAISYKLNILYAFNIKKYAKDEL